MKIGYTYFTSWGSYTIWYYVGNGTTFGVR